MNKLAIFAASIVASVSPAFADGFNVDVHGDVSGFSNNGPARVGYGGGVGYDLKVAPKVFVGAQLGADAVPLGGYIGRNLSAVVRAGVKIAPQDKIYALAGYANQRAFGVDYDGFRAGAGYEHSFGPLFGKIEYRHTSYDNIPNQNEGLVGVGVHF